jgi:molecular chaperone HscC
MRQKGRQTFRGQSDNRYRSGNHKQPTMIPNRLGHFLTPSAVSMDGDTVLVGLTARERQASHPGDTATAFKRYMGTKRRIPIGRRNYSAEELSALVLRSLREDAEAFLGEAVDEAVVTVPAYFNDRQRRATRKAGELAGLKVERLINEPTAAALAYGIHRLDAESRFLVFDLGGGTFDVSILEIFEGIIEVRASTGDNRLGGEDFNELLITMARERFASAWGSAGKGDNGLYQKLREQAERARRSLSTEANAIMRIVWRGQQYDFAISADDFEKKCEPLIARLREPILRSLRDSNLDPGALAEVIMIGGATRMPLVRKTVTRMFGRFPNVSVNPDEAVALGAAVQAGLKARDAELREVVLTDVCPFSLGVGHARQLADGSIEDGLFSPIIERNTTISASRVKRYQTLHANQKHVRFDVFQGEARLIRDNVQIGDLVIPMPPGPAGQEVDVRLSYDINGLLEVDVHVLANDKRFQLIVADEGDDDATAVEHRRNALAALKVHPRDEEANKAAMSRAERCWEDALGGTRMMVEGWIQTFSDAMATQDPRVVDRSREGLLAALDDFEGATLL